MTKVLLIALFLSSLRTRPILSESVLECGISQIIINELIVHGHDTVQGAWPWHVAIFHKLENNEKYACGGTLLTEQHVITAAHCLKNPEDGKPLSIHEIVVKLGVSDIKSTENGGHLRNITTIHTFRNFPKKKLRNDIAILELATEIAFGTYVQPSCVSESEDLTGQYGTVIGWGVDESNKVSAKLKSVRLPVIDVYTCLDSNRDVFGAMLDEGIFCAGYTNGTSICNGDSGGGIFFKENGTWHLGGIVSFSAIREDGSNLCQTQGYGAFTKIHTYLAWIKSIALRRLTIYEDHLYNWKVAKGNYTGPLPRACGKPIMKGVSEFPWMAILRYENNTENKLSCAGALIHNRYVLTTASCTFNTSLYQVRLGGHSAKRIYPARDYEIECVIRYTEAAGTTRNWKDDIALIRLERDVLFEVHIQPICLPVTPALRKLNFSQFLATGWDRMDEFNAIIKAKVRNDLALCQFYWRVMNSSSIYCMNHPNDNAACKLVRGSPLKRNLALQNEQRFVQFGVFIANVNCGFSIYVEIAKYMDWILTNINRTENSQKLTKCEKMKHTVPAQL